MQANALLLVDAAVLILSRVFRQQPAKPVTHGGLVDVMRHLKDYWFDFVELPQ